MDPSGSLPDNDAAPTKKSVWKQIRADFRHYGGSTQNALKRQRSFPSRLWSVSLRLGFWLLLSFRLRNAATRRGFLLRVFSDLLGFWTKVITSSDINAHCTIGSEAEFPHPFGIVIGKGVVIGDRVKIFQGVTIGSSGIGRDSYPKLEDGVTVFANAVIVGEITVGAQAIVGAGAVVLQDVPSSCSAVGNPARVLSKQ